MAIRITQELPSVERMSGWFGESGGEAPEDRVDMRELHQQAVFTFSSLQA
jgi:hypothetical protein